MRNALIIVMLALVTNSSFSQQTKPSPTLTKQDYLLKSKHQKTTAWVFLGGGLALSTIAVASATPKMAEEVGSAITILPGILVGIPPQPVPKKDYTVETVLIIGSVAAIISSISLFESSSKNKRKAMNLSFKNEQVPQIQKASLVYHAIPSLNFKINL